MSDIRVASRYAKSVIDLAIEKGCLDEVHTDMLLLANVCNENRELVSLLKSPIVNAVIIIFFKQYSLKKYCNDRVKCYIDKTSLSAFVLITMRFNALQAFFFHTTVIFNA